MYCDVWDASLGETLECEREPTNEKDRYAVVVKKSGTIVGRAKSNFASPPPPPPKKKKKKNIFQTRVPV